MNDISPLAILWSLFLFSLVIWIILCDIYRLKGHMKYVPGTLKKGAKIIDVDTHPVGSKSSTRYRTIFTFDDGFKYITYKTRIDHRWSSTHISLSQKDIMELATFAYQLHEEAASADSPGSSKKVDIAIKEPLFSDEEAHMKSLYSDDNDDNTENVESDSCTQEESMHSEKRSSKLNLIKIILIFLCVLIACAIPQFLIQFYSFYLGGIPTMILYGISFYLTKKIARSNIGDAKKVSSDKMPRISIAVIFSVLALIISTIITAYALITIDNQQKEISHLKQEISEISELKDDVSSLLLTRKITNSRLESIESTVNFLSDYSLYK